MVFFIKVTIFLLLIFLFIILLPLDDVGSYEDFKFKMICTVIIFLIILLLGSFIRKHCEQVIKDLSAESFNGVSIDVETDILVLDTILEIKSHKNDFDINELRNALLDYQLLSSDDSSFNQVKYTYVQELNAFDIYGNEYSECTIIFTRDEVKLMNFENITSQNIVDIGIEKVPSSKLKEIDGCFGNEDKETNEAVETQTLIEE